MKFRSLAAVLIIILSGAAKAQESHSSVVGTMYGPQGETVSYMWIRAIDATGTEIGRGESSREGEYLLSELPPSVFTLEVGTPCCAYLDYDSDPVTLAGGETAELDIHLEEGDSFNTVGDDPGVIAAAIRSEAVIPDEPPPRMPDGAPNLSGIWLLGTDPFREEIEALPWAEELHEKRVASYGRDHPHTKCLPGDPPITGGAAPFIAKFVQTDDLLVILLEDYPGFRQIFLDGRNHPEYPNPSWMGHSIGWWDGDTLIVDTVGFNDRGWLSAYPRSEQLHIVERYTRTEYGFLKMAITYEDPEVFKNAWSEILPLHLAPHAELIEYVCENNKWAEGPGS